MKTAKVGTGGAGKQIKPKLKNKRFGTVTKQCLMVFYPKLSIVYTVIFHIGRVLLSLAEVTKDTNFKEMPMIGGFGMMGTPLNILSRKYLDL